MSIKPDPKEDMKNLGYKLIYKPHRDIARYMAFYRVNYGGKEIAPPIAKKFEISLGEIWMSEKLRPYEKYVLHHELQEIKYRAEGYDVEEAHNKAVENGEIWMGEKRYEELRREINLVKEDDFIQTPGFGRKLYSIVVNNRPYFHMDELREVEGIGKRRFSELDDKFWCL
ncbi:MAG: hypothetical protein R6U61_01055 [Thermoplasmata archaeon]